MSHAKRLAVPAVLATLVLSVVARFPTVAVAAVCGASWSIVSSPSPGVPPDSLYSASAVSTSDVWAAGYKSTSTYPHTLIEHWDGAHWRSVSSPGASYGSWLYGVSAAASNDAWAVGVRRGSSFGSYTYKTLTQHWDGISWSTVASPNTKNAFDYLFDVVSTAPTAWAVGLDGLSGNSQPQTLVLYWNGSYWVKMKSKNPSTVSNHLTGVGADGAGHVWAVGGEIPLNSTTDVPLIEYLSPQGISVEPSPNVGAGGLGSVAVIGQNDAWAVGALFTGNQYQNSQTLIEHWNGTAWSQVTSPNPSTNDAFTDVTATGPNDVWASGWSVGVSGYKEAITAHYDGSSWTLIPAANVAGQDNVLRGITGLPGTYWTVGQHGGSSTLTEDLCP